jgi:cytochrome c peroxidase
MHDGSLSSLHEVITHYSSGGKAHQNKSEIIKSFTITDIQKKDIIAFLNALTDSSFVSFNE